MQKISIFAVVLSLCVLTPIMSGCAKQKTRSQTVVLQLAFFDDIRNQKLGQALADAFNKSQAGIRVKVSGIAGGGDYRSKLLTMIAGGTAPDLMVLGAGWMVDFASRGSLLNLQSYMENDKEFQSFKKDIYPSSLNACRYQGKFYSAPFWTNSFVLFYNKDIFEKEKVSPPNDKWNLNELLSAGRQITKDTNGDGRIDQYAFFDYLSFPTLFSYIKRNGGQPFSSDGRKCLIAEPKSIQAIQLCLDFINKYHITPSPLSGDERLRNYEEAFSSGKVAMTISGRWSMLVFSNDKNLKWGTAPQPQGKKVFKLCGTEVLAASSQTKHPKECWEFLKFIMSEEAQKMVCDIKVDIPVRISVANSPLFLNKFNRPQDNQVFLKEMEGAEEFTHFPGEDEFFQKANPKLELVLAGKKDLKTACREIAQEYEKIKE